MLVRGSLELRNYGNRYFISFLQMFFKFHILRQPQEYDHKYIKTIKVRT